MIVCYSLDDRTVDSATYDVEELAEENSQAYD
jgi:hypothetical protein